MTDKIMQYWPFKDKKPRMTQELILDWMETLNEHIKYVIVEAPVGVGKSALSVNYSAFLDNSKGNALILTPQKILQRQYESSFDDSQLFSLYGKSNYTCHPKSTNCDIGSDLKPKCESCPHKAAYNKARTSPNTVLNYTLALILMTEREDVKINKRKLIVCDEAHTLEHHLTEFRALQIGDKRCHQFKVDFKLPKNEEDLMEWLKTIYKPAVEREVLTMKSMVTEIEDRYVVGDSMDKMDMDTMNKFKDYSKHLALIEYYTLSNLDYIKNNYVLVNEKTSFKLKALYGRDTFRSTIDMNADRILFLSSTILNKDSFCSDLGIDSERTAFISTESEFKVENRPVFYIPKAKMNYGWDKPERSYDRKKMIEAILAVLQNHDNESGIIHSGSFQVAQWLVNELENKIPHRIYHHNPQSGLSRDEVIDTYSMNAPHEPSLLISPSITEGLDLNDDKGRFAIFAKTPYPNLGDAWIKRRMNISNEWYMRQSIINTIQGSGRVVRNNNDWGVTYIMDETFNQLYKSMSKSIPQWFKDAFTRL